jgi:nucleoporin NUP82
VFNAPHAFSEDSLLPQYLDNLRTSRHKTTITQDVKLSPMTLNVFTEVHKVLSDETSRLRDAAAEVFIRCQSLQGELREQILKAGEVQRRIDGMLGDGEEESDRVQYDRRIEQARDRQEALKLRIDKLKQTVGRSTNRELSAKERAWFGEVRSAEKNACMPEGDDEEDAAADDPQNQPKQLWQRFEDVKELQDSLTMQLETLNVSKSGEENRGQELRVPDNIRKSKMQQVQGALARESALVEAVRMRLEKLQTDAGN